jgi:DNA-binding Xre family transcriptional regulator
MNLINNKYQIKMSESSTIQLTNFGKLLLEKSVTKRQLAAHLGVHENGMIRILSSPDIKRSRLTQIAECLNMDVSALVELVFQSYQQEQHIKEGAATRILPSPELPVASVSQAGDASMGDQVASEAIVPLLAESINLQKQNGEVLKQITALLMPGVR